MFFTVILGKFTLTLRMTTSPVTVPATTGRVLHWAVGYDLLAWLLTHCRDFALREKLVRLARLADGDRVRDVGCGTGSLAIAAKRRVGAAGDVVGIDASPEMVARATSKAKKTGTDVSFRIAAAEALPFPDAQFDAALSTLMLHHLPRQARQQFGREIRRVLKSGGRVLVVDFAHAPDKRGFLAYFHRHGHVDPRDIQSLLEEAGFNVIDSAAVGISSLHFVLAAIPA